MTQETITFLSAQAQVRNQCGENVKEKIGRCLILCKRAAVKALLLPHINRQTQL